MQWKHCEVLQNTSHSNPHLAEEFHKSLSFITFVYTYPATQNYHSFFMAPIKADHVGIRKLSKDIVPIRALLKALSTTKTSLLYKNRYCLLSSHE